MPSATCVIAWEPCLMNDAAAPPSLQGLRHLALTVLHLEACTDFYTRLLGMTVAWHPDANNVYLTFGQDSLALHRAPDDFHPDSHQRLDHLGFFVSSPDAVDAWHAWLSSHTVKILAAPRNHRDGSRSFYCADPDGNCVQLIHLP